MTPEMKVIREREAAEVMGVSVAALRRWRRERRGPKYIRMERCIGYLLADLQTYLERCSANSASQGGRR